MVLPTGVPFLPAHQPTLRSIQARRRRLPGRSPPGWQTRQWGLRGPCQRERKRYQCLVRQGSTTAWRTPLEESCQMGNLAGSFPNPARACCSSFSRAVLLQAVTIAVRVAHKLNDPSFVREPVEKGSGHFVIGKNLIPVTKTQITGNDHGNLFIQIAHQLKKQLRSSLVDRNEAEFIENEEIKLDKTSEETGER